MEERSYLIIEEIYSLKKIIIITIIFMTLKEIVNRVSKFGVLNFIVGVFEILFHRNRLRILKSLYLNLRVLPFKQAIRLPIVIYGKSKILSLMGKCHIEGSIKFGMIKFGAPSKVILVSCDKTYIRINGDVYFEGEADIQSGCEFNILSGKIVLGEKVRFGEKCKIICVDFINIGYHTRFAGNCVLMDSNFHYLLNAEKRKINKCSGPIVIGEKCWIGIDTTILRGTHLPDKVVVVAGSLCSRIYQVPANSLIGGNPAILLKENVARVWNMDNQIFLHHYFRENGDLMFYHLPVDTDIFDFCEPNK